MTENESASDGIRLTDRPRPTVPDHELIREIGRGSYGEVWLARNIMGMYRAVKFVYKDNFDDERPFEREYNGIQRFEPISRSHESQVDILHVGRQEGCFFYVMELADDAERGQDIEPSTYSPKTLRTVMQKEGRLSADHALDIGLSLTTALQHLHSHRLAHRDIKPSNIIFVNGLPKLADIGLVSSVDATRSFVGTEGFLPPEGPGTAEADIYSLGKVLYEACTGRDRKDYPELPTMLGELPDRERLLELNAIIAKACREDARERYSSAEQMRQDLLLMQSGKSVIRLRTIERRLALAIKLGAVAAGLALLLGFGYFYQARHGRIVAELAERSQTAERQSRERLVSLQVANGIARMNEGESAHALGWFAKALANVRGDPAREKAHRIRIGSLLDDHPKLIHQLAHPDAVFRCAFSPDGTKLATHSRDGAIRLFDLASGQLLQSIPQKPNYFWVPYMDRYAPALTFSADGRRIIIRSFWVNLATEVFDLTQGRRVLLNREGRILDSIDGEAALITTSKKAAQIINLQTGEALSRLYEVPGEIYTGRLTPDAKHIALLYSDAPRGGHEPALLEVRDRETGAPVGPALPMEAGGRYLLSSDATRLVVSAEFQDRSPPYILQTASSNDGVQPRFDWGVQGFVVNPDNQWLVLESPDGNYKRVWNVDTEESIVLPYKHEPIRHLATSPDNLLLATASDDGTVRLWNRSTGAAILQLRHSQYCYGANFSPDGERLATTSHDGTVRVWDLASAHEPRLALWETGSVLEAAFSPDGSRIVTLTDDLSTVRFWDTGSGRPLTPPLFETPAYGSLTFSPDGQNFVIWGPLFYKATAPARGAWVWNTDPSAGVKPVGVNTNLATSEVHFDPASNRLLTRTQGNVELWDAATGTLLREPLATNSPTHASLFLPTKNEIATAGTNQVHIWDATTGTLLRTLQTPAGPSRVVFVALAASGNGAYLAASAMDQRIYVWELSTGTLVSEPLWHTGTPAKIVFSPDSTSFATFSGAPWCKVWKIGAADPLLPALKHDRSVHGAEFSPDGASIATRSWGGAAKLWDFNTGDLIYSVPHRIEATVATFHPLSSELMTAGEDWQVYVWDSQPSAYTLPQITSLAEVLFANRLDEQESYWPVSPQRTGAQLEILRQEVPQVFRTSPSQRAFWHYRMMLLAYAANNWKAAVWHISRALAAQPSLAEGPTAHRIFEARGNALAELGRFSEALKDFELALRMEPLELINWDRLLKALLAQNLTNEYAAACEKLYSQFRFVEEIQSYQQIACKQELANYATYDASPSNCSAALQMLTAPFAFHPDHPYLLTLRGKLLYRLGRFTEAVANLEKGDSGDPETPLVLAMAQHRLGNHAVAKQIYEAGARFWEDMKKMRQDWSLRVVNDSIRNEAKATLGL